jgi:uncharacterized protein (TIGR00251 family)
MKLFLKVRVKPRAHQQKLEKISPGEYKLSVVSPPSKGKANHEVVNILAFHFDLPQSWVRIVRGENSRNKVISLEIDEDDPIRLKRIKDLIQGKEG